MTREQIINCIYQDEGENSCPKIIPCDGDCLKCADKQLLEYEQSIRNKAFDDFMNMAFEIIKSEQDTRYGYLDGADIREMARELKGGEKNEV